MEDFDKKIIIENKLQSVIGLDEVGRGPLAGPVVACAVKYYTSLDNKFLAFETLKSHGITDSKKLNTKKRREILSRLNIEYDKLVINQKVKFSLNNQFELEYCLIEISNHRIDEINILNASLEAMEQAYFILSQNESGEAIFIDGNKIPKKLQQLNSMAIVKGDSKSLIIGLASIIAKEYRDNLMEKLAKKYPGYGLEKHAGYPTKGHKDAIKKLGLCEIHRKSFKCD